MSIRKDWFQQIKRGEEHYQYGKHHPTYFNILGQKFGKLTVTKQDPGKGVECRCECGNTHIERYTVDLRRGHRKSCGKCNNLSSPNFKFDEDALILKWAGIKSTQEIAKLVEQLGYRKASISTIKNRVRTLNRHREKSNKISLRRKGELYPHAKCSDNDVELCRCLYDEGLTPSQIAEKMEMNRSHVSSIVYYHSRTEPALSWSFR
ncbi:hypothetical protein [Vibrio sagamiensis]|uniref:Uncharacterized protein n=1 Tax=Vibrio sagamiensis NBRC 104589 TaxID=1219064 RepID=A0A511QJV1_9VIBR|nr:hypothetical protein [Vibrio sagamiensis]PNQ54423.1 hypothetical protein C1141_15970 [Vibrio agarivorans]GEM77579.1 hypothetical protein VSA01S_36910 [Vibrio sagamiensis NBRC 104589]